MQVLLLDSNAATNTAAQRDIATSLYPADHTQRLEQQILLGIGGVRALHALGLNPSVYHLLDANCAFAAIERARLLSASYGLSFVEAIDAARRGNVLSIFNTTPAVNSQLDVTALRNCLASYCLETGVDFDQVISLGDPNPSDPGAGFSPAALAVRASSYRISMSRTHQHVMREAWSPFWRNLPTAEVPVTVIPNGVHLSTWVNEDLAEIYDRYLDGDWRDPMVDSYIWEAISEIPDAELLGMRDRRRRKLISYVRAELDRYAAYRNLPRVWRERLSDTLDPEGMIIGIASEFDTSKRPTLLFRDYNRLARILLDRERPVQVIVAGKAHPRNHPAKTLIREISMLSRDPRVAHSFVFLENFDFEMSRQLVQGVDVWLSCPKVGSQTGLTAGMKAGVNGALNVGVRHGWFAEWHEQSGGWHFGSAGPYSEEHDEIDAESLYTLLENEIVPAFYDVDGQSWSRRMKRALLSLTPLCSTARVIKDYVGNIYGPASESFKREEAAMFVGSRKRLASLTEIQRRWTAVRFVGDRWEPPKRCAAGTSVTISVNVELAGLTPDDVNVEVVFGTVRGGGVVDSAAAWLMSPVDVDGSIWRFAGEVKLPSVGRFGVSFRISIRDTDDPMTRACGTLMKWAEPLIGQREPS